MLYVHCSCAWRSYICRAGARYFLLVRPDSAEGVHVRLEVPIFEGGCGTCLHEAPSVVYAWKLAYFRPHQQMPYALHCYVIVKGISSTRTVCCWITHAIAWTHPFFIKIYVRPKLDWPDRLRRPWYESTACIQLPAVDIILGYFYRSLPPLARTLPLSTMCSTELVWPYREL